MYSPEDSTPYYECDWQNDTEEVTLGIDEMLNHKVYISKSKFEDLA